MDLLKISFFKMDYPKFSLVFIVLLLFSCVLLFGACTAKSNEGETAENLSGIKRRKLTPRITFENLQGMEHSFSPESKHLTVLHFWATWCKPCLAEFPEISHSLPRLASDSVQFFFA